MKQIFLLVGLCGALMLQAENWARFRGPSGAGVGAAVGLVFASRGSYEGSDGTAERDRHAQRFSELQLGDPEALSPEQVRELLRELDGRPSDAVLGEAAEEQRKRLAAQLSNHVDVESTTEAERGALLAEIGTGLQTLLAKLGLLQLAELAAVTVLAITLTILGRRRAVLLT